MLLNFARDFDKKLDGNLSVHYQAGHTYDVPDDLVAEVQPFVEGNGPAEIAPAEPLTAVPVTPPAQPEPAQGNGEG